jgi:phosphoglycolate phosphatase
MQLLRLVLFDIDGTLVSSAGAGRRAMERALLEVFGCSGDSTYRYDGKTDRQIVRELMRSQGFDDRAIDLLMPAVLEAYLANLRQELAVSRARVRALQGVEPLLDAIAASNYLVPGLLTGNLEQGAYLKLAAAGLEPGAFRVGAFGSDHEDRFQLPPIALQRARRSLGRDVGSEELVIIGDTPNDIACGRPLGVRVIAVATGQYPFDELARHRPWALFSDLSDTDAVLAAIENA